MKAPREKTPVTPADLDDRVRKRIYTFYVAGVINLVLGLYVLIAGRGQLGGTSGLIALFFIGFAAVDFYFPKLIRRKWREEQEKMRAAAQQPGSKA